MLRSLELGILDSSYSSSDLTSSRNAFWSLSSLSISSFEVKFFLKYYLIYLFYKKKIKMKNLTSKELIEKLDNDQNAFLLDVRSEEEYEESNIPNSKLLNIRDPQSFMDGLQDLDKSKNFYVYCHSGVRSVQACQIMKTFGFNNLYNLLGGISEWTGKKTNN
jgi:rhodanese-related sulfurtransferase